jgi:UrcA family protein
VAEAYVLTKVDPAQCGLASGMRLLDGGGHCSNHEENPMTGMRFRPASLGPAAAMCALAFIAAPTMASAQSAIGGVTVTAPRTLGKTSSGIPIEQVSMSATVAFKDLDLKKPQGAAELDKRVRSTAASMCKKLEADYPVGTPDAVTCAKQAVKNAEPQVQAAKAG